MVNQMNPFLTSPEERIALWRQLRDSIADLPIKDRLIEIDKWWLSAPISTWLIDLDFFEKSHLPWELLYDNNWTPSSILYMKEQTLLLIKNKIENKIEIAYINDIPSATDLLIMIVDDTYVVNYSLGETILLSNIVSNIKIIKKYKLDCNSHK